MRGQDLPHAPALDALAPPVDHAHFGEPGGRRRLDVVADHVGDVARRERVEVEGVLDRDDDGMGEGWVRVVSGHAGRLARPAEAVNRSGGRASVPPAMAPGERTVGIDVGATLAKLALRNAATLVTEHHASGALEQLRRRVETLAPSGVVLTGGGAAELAALLGGVPVRHVDEVTAWVRGGALVAAEEGMTLPARHLLVSLGTGTSIVRVEDGRGDRVGGTALGGGTVLGLGRLLVGTASFAELAALAAEGDRRQVDLLVGDVYRAGAGTLPGDLTAASFAKLDSTRPADLAHAVMGLVGENVALVAGGLARAVGVETVVFCGSTLSDNPALREIVTRVATMLGLDGRFLAGGAYCGAVGAAASERS